MDTKNPYLLPVAIVLGGVILAIAIFVTRTGNVPLITEENLAMLRPISAQDHIVGNPKAQVVIVEYSDIDCEYCKNFHTVLQQVMTEYGPTANVAWVYRHFPILSVHPYAGMHAEAAECVADLGSNDLFFAFIDGLHQAAPGGSQFDPVGYPVIVSRLGLPPTAFEECMTSDRMTGRVAADSENAFAVGATGAPFTVVLVEGKKPVPITGALPYESLKQVIEEALSEPTP